MSRVSGRYGEIPSTFHKSLFVAGFSGRHVSTFVMAIGFCEWMQMSFITYRRRNLSRHTCASTKQSLITSIIIFACWNRRLRLGKPGAKRLLTERDPLRTAGVGTSQPITPSRECAVIVAPCDGRQRPLFLTTQ